MPRPYGQVSFSIPVVVWVWENGERKTENGNLAKGGYRFQYLWLREGYLFLGGLCVGGVKVVGKKKRPRKLHCVVGFENINFTIYQKSPLFLLLLIDY